LHYIHTLEIQADDDAARSIARFLTATCSVPNGPGGPVSGQNWPGPRVTGQADERPISTGFTLVETMGDWANHGS